MSLPPGKYVRIFFVSDELLGDDYCGQVIIPEADAGPYMNGLFPSEIEVGIIRYEDITPSTKIKRKGGYQFMVIATAEQLEEIIFDRKTISFSDVLYTSFSDVLVIES